MRASFICSDCAIRRIDGCSPPSAPPPPADERGRPAAAVCSAPLGGGAGSADRLAREGVSAGSGWLGATLSRAELAARAPRKTAPPPLTAVAEISESE